jgi:hypothetical protein
MGMFKKFASCVFAAVISSYAYADIIELDALNPDHCRQQILNSADNIPVIAAYLGKTTSGDSVEFMKKFELLAKAHPERTFFKWDADKDMLHLTKTLCLQQLGISIQPNIMLLGVVNDKDTGKGFVTSPFRLSWAGEMTMPEMHKFIDISDSNIRKSLLSPKNHL